MKSHPAHPFGYNTTTPSVTKSMFEMYCGHKRQGISSQQEKAHKLFASEKIVTVKVIKQGKLTYVNGIIKRSYGQISRPAVIELSDVDDELPK